MLYRRFVVGAITCLNGKLDIGLPGHGWLETDLTQWWKGEGGGRRKGTLAMGVASWGDGWGLLTCFGSTTPEALQPSPEIVQAALQVTGHIRLIDKLATG